MTSTYIIRYYNIYYYIRYICLFNKIRDEHNVDGRVFHPFLFIVTIFYTIILSFTKNQNVSTFLKTFYNNINVIGDDSTKKKSKITCIIMVDL